MTTDRAVVIGQLKAEKDQAEWCYEAGRAAELQAQIDRLSAAGSAVNPALETTGRTRAARPSRSRNAVVPDRH